MAEIETGLETESFLRYIAVTAWLHKRDTMIHIFYNKKAANHLSVSSFHSHSLKSRNKKWKRPRPISPLVTVQRLKVRGPFSSRWWYFLRRRGGWPDGASGGRSAGRSTMKTGSQLDRWEVERHLEQTPEANNKQPCVQSTRQTSPNEILTEGHTVDELKDAGSTSFS